MSIILSELIKSKNMEEITINWDKTTSAELTRVCPRCDFYILSRRSKIIYIGIAYDQNVADEIRQTIRRFNLSPQGLSLWIGGILLEESTIERKSLQLVRDIECLLIYTHSEDLLNIQCKENYTGRDNLKVKRWGGDILRRCVRVESERIYLSC